MNDKIQKSLAASLEVEEKLLPYVSYLLQDLWSLGSSVDQILEFIDSLHLPSATASILDLGCGKGAVCVPIASKFGCKVVGVDFMSEFLEDARNKATEFHVSHLCSFIKHDILDFVVDEHEFDVVILASLGGIFKTFKNTVAKLRTQVKVGGYIVIDDGYLRNRNNLSRKGYGHYRNHETTLRELTAFNDRLIAEINTTAFNRKINEEYLMLIQKRSQELIDQNPELEKDLRNYIRLQTEECEILNTEIEGMIWVLQKEGGITNP